MRILIDADGCPVVDITIKIAREHQMECVLLCDTSHVFEKAGAQNLTVSKGADSVDFALVNLLRPGDLVITQDYGLAAMCLARKARVVRQDGMEYTADNIDARDTSLLRRKDLLRTDISAYRVCQNHLHRQRIYLA